MQMNWLWGYFIPIGMLLLTWGGLSPRKARRVTPLAALAVAVAILGYWAVGYAFHLGGAYALNPNEPELKGLDLIWSPLDKTAGPGWGVIGLAGFFLTGDEVTPTFFSLFLTYLPLVATAVFLAVLALADVRRWMMVAAGGLLGAIVVPLAACWAWGGGWLAKLGITLELGHGFVDFGGSAVILWVPAMMVMGLLLFQERRLPEESNSLPPAYFPLLANLGTLFLGLGWTGWALSAPFHTSGALLDLNRTAVNLFLGLAGAVLTSQLYAWLVTGELEPLLAARGAAAGWCALLAGAPFLPPWAALVVGLFAGLLAPLALYVANGVLRLKDSAAAAVLGLMGGAWGVLSVAIFADGRWGQGWNGADVAGGVRGLFVGSGGQLLAQLVGLVVLGLWGFAWGALLAQIARMAGPHEPKPAPVLEPADLDAEGVTLDAVAIEGVIPDEAAAEDVSPSDLPQE
ncbi:MAG: hypothetical protein RBT47_08000 [Anaerolineae bacterium]|jgi:Amt family ammonium transporter|nr:hypothetical protein [Anaerolineae bacterium]